MFPGAHGRAEDPSFLGMTVLMRFLLSGILYPGSYVHKRKPRHFCQGSFKILLWV